MAKLESPGGAVCEAHGNIAFIYPVIGVYNMRKILHGFGKFYSRVMMNMIGIFIFVGILSILFGEQGWMPNKDIYAISQFIYIYGIPIMVAYISGNQIRGKEQGEGNELHPGGVIAVMAEAGLMAANQKAAILGAMILGPCCGLLWKRVLEAMIRKANIRIEMLVRNLIVAGVGCILAIGSFYLFAPGLAILNQLFMKGISYLIKEKAIFLFSILMEPAKILFLNNSIHYGILLPLGLSQAAEEGKSILFLLETNPGPGFGILLALFYQKRERRKEYAASMFVQMIGGIHEVYFSEVLSNLWLLIALIAGGTAGNLCFLWMDAGAVTAISPGSIFTFLLACMNTGLAGAVCGILVSVLISFAAASLILYIQKCCKTEPSLPRKGREEEKKEERNRVEKREIKKIGFVCDAGVGSSSMGAALLRRKLKELQLEGIEVAAYASDQIPKDLDLMICQRNFKELLLPEISEMEIYTMESLVSQQELSDIALGLQRGRNNEG